MTKAQEKALDVLLSKHYKGKRCEICKKPANHSHHLIRRGDKYFRWLPKNLMPVCVKCHSLIHSGSIGLPEHISKNRDELFQDKTILKQWVVENGLGEDEVFEYFKDLLKKC